MATVSAMRNGKGILVVLAALLSLSAISFGAMAPTFFTVSNKTVDVGQNFYMTTLTPVSGGSGTYTGNWQWFPPASSNIANGNTIPYSLASLSNNDVALVDSYFGTNSLGLRFFDYSAGTNFPINTTGTNVLTGTWRFNTIITDGNPANTLILTNTLTIYQEPFAALSVSANPIIDYGQNATLQEVISGGTGAFFDNTVLANGLTVNSIQVADGTTLVSFNVAPTSISGNVYSLNATVTDSGTSTPFNFNSPDATVTTNSVTISFSNSTINAKTGSAVSFNAYVSGGFNVNTYQWYESSSGSSGSFSVYNGGTGGTYNGLYINSLTAGTYYFRLKTTDTGTTTPFVKNSTIIQVDVSSGGGGGGSTTSSTTSATTTSTASTTVPTTTASTTSTIAPHTNSSANVTVNLTVNHTVDLSLDNGHIILALSTSHSGPANVVITKLNFSTSPPPPALDNYTDVEAFNISINSMPKLNITANLTLTYNCSIPSTKVFPYLFINGSWAAVTPFSVNATACTVKFSVPADPIAAVMEYQAPSTTTSTSSASTTTTSQKPSSQGNSSLYEEIGVVVATVVIAGVAYALTRRKKRA